MNSSFDASLGDADYLERPLNDLDDDETDEESVTAATSSGDPCRPNGSAKLSGTGSAGRGASTKDSGSKRGGKSGASAASVGKDGVSSTR